MQLQPNDFQQTAQEINFIPRAIAIIIDWVVVYVAFAILLGIAPLLLFMGPLVYIALWAAYNALMYNYKWQATLGKRIMSLYVTMEDGSKPDIKTGLIRGLMSYVSALILCIGFLLPFFRPDKKTLHDLVAKTKVEKGQLN